ncbi:MAG: 16S rRNA (cytosine(1402)-N(4))-methyltransferase RsmH [Candidatus Midichloria sp.]|nr:MAG: 16S rRNA (cytosine(1402)-N(4))-methyltransferase RsmH [Candidatus Midichloria sp.]
MKNPHISVLLNEVIERLSVRKDGVYLDCTFGAGGYSSAILEKEDCYVCAIDRDTKVMTYAEKLIKNFGERFSVNFSEFANLEETIQYFPYQFFDGIVFDVGVSSMQIDSGYRGFSFAKNGPLDMRMDQNQDIDAAFIVNNYSEEELIKIIRDLGDEKKARSIVKAIINSRKQEPISTTVGLANIIKKAVGNYNDTIHPATRTFQALRIAVNDELEQLRVGLKSSIELLKIGGVIAVVTFHSGEDETVKEFFNSLVVKPSKRNKYSHFSKQQISNDKQTKFELVTKKPITPSDQEVLENIRSRSAKLRVIRRIRA